jgi:uncharacterized protein GlcG (DUF336 family)
VSSREGIEYGTAASGVRRADSGNAWILVDAANNNRYPATADTEGDLTAAEVDALLSEALSIANRARAQIRRPLGSRAEVSIAVVGTGGAVLGLVRTPDGPMFGIDVAVQKARTATYFSDRRAYATLVLAEGPPERPDLSIYLSQAVTFLDDPRAFLGDTAWSARAIGNLHRPTFPDGLVGTPNGPLSTGFPAWSPLNPGLQLDFVYNQLVRLGLNFDDAKPCVRLKTVNRPIPPFNPIPGGIQVFPGGIPIYRGDRLVGAIGVSGDGVDQDDMIAFLGLHNAGARLGTGIGNAPVAMRADRLSPQGTRLRYVQCPQAPFLGSDEQNVCAGK